MMSRDELEFHLRIARRELKKADADVVRSLASVRHWNAQIEALETVIAKLKDEVPAGRV